MRSMLLSGSKGQVLVERDERGGYVVSQRFESEQEARAFALRCAHGEMSRAVLEGWEFDSDMLRDVERQIADARADDDGVLEQALRHALLDAGMREIAQGHPQAREVAKAVVHIVDSEPDVIGAKVTDLRSRMVG